MEDPAVRAPLTSSPRVDWLDAGAVAESAGYRVIRSRGVSDHLLIHSRAGGGRFGSAGAPDLSAGPGTVTLLAPGTPHDYGIAADSRAWDLAFCHFRPRPEWRLLLDWPQERPGIGRLVLGDVVAGRVGEALDRAGYHSRSTQRRARLFAMNALEQALLWCDSQNPRAGLVDERLVRALEHLDRHLHEPLGVGDLARVAHLSPSRFAHLFAAQLGETPGAYLERQRMTVARQLLEQTDRAVADVAASVGYADALYFSTRFRRHFGDPPTTYRRGRAR